MQVDRVQFFPIDNMHQVCLGVMKRILMGLMHGGKKVRLSRTKHCEISARLEVFQQCITKDFNHKPGPLSDLAHWKATEYWTSALYAGSYALQGIVEDDFLHHFRCFSVAISILVSQTLSADQFANKLLIYFVNRAVELYGSELILYNVHSLVHLSVQVEQFGPLDNSSAFIFENFLQTLKRLVRSTRNPVLQVANQLKEKNQFSISNCYESIALTNSLGSFSTNQPNNSCILEDGRCCRIVSVANDAVTCMVFKHTETLYTSPCESRVIGVYLTRLPQGILIRLPRNLIANKAMRLTQFLQSEMLFIRLLHTMWLL